MIRMNPMHDTKNPPGQIRGDVTLGDYIKRKEEAINQGTQKLTFDQWAETKINNKDVFTNLRGFNGMQVLSLMEAAWKAGRENM
jgi:hypothetical protein